MSASALQAAAQRPPPARVGGEAPAAKAVEGVAPLPPAGAGLAPPQMLRQSDNGLTPVNDPAQAAATDLREVPGERLRDALASSVNQRVLRSASGEVSLPDLGRVTVRAHTANDAVTVEVQASVPATAQLLHARADAIAADVRAADVPLGSMTFEGSGTWTGRDGDGSGARSEAPAAATVVPPAPDGAGAGRSRVRIVL